MSTELWKLSHVQTKQALTLSFSHSLSLSHSLSRSLTVPWCNASTPPLCKDSPSNPWAIDLRLILHPQTHTHNHAAASLHLSTSLSSSLTPPKFETESLIGTEEVQAAPAHFKRSLSLKVFHDFLSLLLLVLILSPLF